MTVPRRVDDFYLEALRRLGVPAALRARLAAFLRARHPGDQDRVYHGLAHTCEVASLTGRLLHGWPNVPPERKVLLVLAAALHDVDPDRAPITPARVDATIEHLEKDPAARRLLRDFGARFGFTPNQVAALIMATDYAATPQEMRKKLDAFERAHRRAFGRDPWIAEWGRRLAFWDKISTYLGPRDVARKRVAGLVREFRRSGELSKDGFRDMSLKFLTGLRRDPLFDYLPPEDRARFDIVLRDFAKTAVRRRRA